MAVKRRLLLYGASRGLGLGLVRDLIALQLGQPSCAFLDYQGQPLPW